MVCWDLREAVSRVIMEVLAPWHEALEASHLEFHCPYQEKMGS